jgi:hypothetical protein
MFDHHAFLLKSYKLKELLLLKLILDCIYYLVFVVGLFIFFINFF